MGDGFYRSKDPTNSIKVLKEHIVYRQIKHTISRHEHKTQQVPSLQYGVTRGQLPQKAGLPGLDSGGAAATVSSTRIKVGYRKQWLSAYKRSNIASMHQESTKVTIEYQ